MTVFDLWLGAPAPQPAAPPAPVQAPPILPKKIWKPKEKPKVTIKDLPTEVSSILFVHHNKNQFHNRKMLTCSSASHHSVR